MRLVENYRPHSGEKAKKRVLYNIGSENTLTDGEPDFLERLRKSFREGHPILPELEPFVHNATNEEKPKVVRLEFPVTGDSPDGVFSNKLYADVLLNAYMKELGLSQLLTSIKSRRKIEYDLLGFAKLLVYGRLLKPTSKWATVGHNESYFRPIVAEDFNPYKVYDTIDIFHEYQADIFQTINKALQNRTDGRNTSVVFYDVTNFFFETELNDRDVMDANGVVIEEGLRKRGHSKENRPQPIVQMGLFMDKAGVPVGIKSFSGNTVDKSTLIPAITETIQHMGLSRYIYCADRGLCTMGNLAFLVNDGQGYLLSKSIKKSKKEDREWIIDPKGYTEVRDKNGQVVFKYKSQIVTRTSTDENGKVISFLEKMVAFWSLDYYKREQHQMESFAEFLTKLEVETGNFTLNASQVRQIQRFLKDEVLESLDPKNDPAPEAEAPEDKPSEVAVEAEQPSEMAAETTQSPEAATEESPSATKQKRRRLTPEEKAEKEAAKQAEKARRAAARKEARIQREAAKKAEQARNKSLKAARKKDLDEQLKNAETTRTMIDWDKVNQWRNYAGYYQIVTSELEMEDMAVIDIYRGLTQIENRFRTMKGAMQTRPIFLRTPERIDGHLVISYVALTIETLIQGKVKLHLGLDAKEGKSWCLGLSPERIQDALNALQVEALPENYLRFRSRTEDQAGRDLQTILDAHGIRLESRLYTPGELRKLRSSVVAL